MKKILSVCLAAIMICLSSCAPFMPPQTAKTPSGPTQTIKPYEDVRFKNYSTVDFTPDVTLIETLWFNENTKWPQASKKIAQEVMEKGKTPGLGVRKLHEQGITGKGINVAIIDQNLVKVLDHPEFKGKIVKYFDTGTKQPADQGSMHGPAVASLLVGETIGTAPGANLYFVAAPSWTADAQYYADALNWIVDKNEKLPAGEKIRVVSVSAAPSGPGSPFTKNNKAWDAAYTRAAEAGILVLDCTNNHRIFADCYYDPDDPDTIAKCIPGWPGVEVTPTQEVIYVPSSYRTTAEEYQRGDFSYQYTGRGGSSWAVPYLAGVLALGWQVKPDLSNSQIIELLFNSAYLTEDGAKIINPPAFIEMVRQAGNP